MNITLVDMPKVNATLIDLSKILKPITNTAGFCLYRQNDVGNF